MKATNLHVWLRDARSYRIVLHPVWLFCLQSISVYTKCVFTRAGDCVGVAKAGETVCIRDTIVFIVRKTLPLHFSAGLIKMF